MTIIKTWFGEIELHNGQIVRSNVLQTDAVAIALQLQREEFTDLDKRCRSRLREMAIQLGLVTSEHDYISLLRALLIAQAGSLESLARMPASKIQVMGATKALFKHLQYGAKPPKHGIIYQHPLIRGSPLGKRGKIARTMAAKLAIAARIDFYSKKVHPELLAQMEKRIREINNPAIRDKT